MLQSASPVIDVWLSTCNKNQTSISDESLTSLFSDRLRSGAVKCGTWVDKLFSRYIQVFFHKFKFYGDTITVDFLPFLRIQEAGFDVQTKVKIFR